MSHTIKLLFSNEYLIMLMSGVLLIRLLLNKNYNKNSTLPILIPIKKSSLPAIYNNN